MRNHHCITFAVLFVIIGITSETWAISTRNKDNENNESTKIKSPSPTEEGASSFTSRLGNSPSFNSKKPNDEEMKPSVKLFERKDKKTILAASSKSPKLALPDKSEKDENTPPEEILEGKETEIADAPQGKEGSFDGDIRDNKYPRIYFGATPPSKFEEDDSGDLPYSKNYFDHESPHHPSRYNNYPKEFVQKKNEQKSKNEKKRLEKHHELLRPPYLEHAAHHDYSNSASPESHLRDSSLPHYYASEELHHEGNEDITNGYSVDPERSRPTPNGGRHYEGHYNHGHGGGIEILSKALHLLVPSALLLTGLSAVFPNRLHVPTNDPGYNQGYFSNVHNRNKRSARYDNEERILQPEHRYMENDGILLVPSTPHKNYNFEIGSPRGRFSQSLIDKSLPEFKSFPTGPENQESENDIYPKRELPKEGKVSIVRESKFPEDVEGLQYYGVRLASKGSNSIVPISSVVSNNTLIAINSKGKKVRTQIKYRRKLRPLPTLSTSVSPSTEKSMVEVIQSQSIATESPVPANVQNIAPTISPSPPTSNEFNAGDAYLRSLVEDNVEKKERKNMDLAPDSAVVGLITSYAQHDQESPECQKRALCELAIKGKSPTASKFETFLWSLATLVPEEFSRLYELDEIFKATKSDNCNVFNCYTPNLDLQV